ncbi:SET domain-containing protein [Aureococcus anophagefferens]|nr:SET domain-containing protein [Aureococcus anophagefferens]
MDKLSDELTHTLRAKLAQEVELDVSSLRLSHGLMKLEEEQAKLDVVVSARTAEFAEARAIADAARLGEVLPAEFDDVGREDLTLGRLAAFREALERLKVVEAERAVELALLRESSLALVKELDDEAVEAYDEFEGDDDYVRSDGSVLAKARNSLAAAKVDRAKRRLAALRDEKKGRLSRLSTLGEEISLLWERLDVGEAQQLSFRAAVKHSSISRATFDIGEAELGKLAASSARLAELVASRRARIRALWDEMTPLLKLIEKREELLTERTALHVLQKDASRLLRRGPGAATERKYEFEAMKRVKQLPKLTEKLFEKLVEWETKQSPVLRDGVRYLDKMRDDQKEAAQERAQALEAKKIEATIRKRSSATGTSSEPPARETPTPTPRKTPAA